MYTSTSLCIKVVKTMEISSAQHLICRMTTAQVCNANIEKTALPMQGLPSVNASAFKRIFTTSNTISLYAYKLQDAEVFKNQ